MKIGLLVLHIYIPGCTSLKEKRRRLNPLLVRLGREFNISIAEVDYQDKWRDALVACTLVSNDHNHVQQSLYKVPHWIEKYWPDVDVVDDQFEIL